MMIRDEKLGELEELVWWLLEDGLSEGEVQDRVAEAVAYFWDQPRS